MKLTKASKRDRKIQKRRTGHQEDGRSVFLIRDIERRRALEKKRELEEKLSRLKGENQDDS